MKFTQLPLGARFVYRGQSYRKVSSIQAADEDGEVDKLIPRSAAVTLLDGQGEKISREIPDTIPRSALQDAITRFIGGVRMGLGGVEPPLNSDQAAGLNTLLDTAHRTLLDDLATETKRIDPD